MVFKGWKIVAIVTVGTVVLGVPHKAVAEVSKSENLYERLVVVNHGWQSEPTDGWKGGWSGGLSIRLCTCLVVYLSIYLCFYLFLSFSICIYRSVCLSLYLSVYLGLCLSISHVDLLSSSLLFSGFLCHFWPSLLWSSFFCLSRLCLFPPLLVHLSVLSETSLQNFLRIVETILTAATKLTVIAVVTLVTVAFVALVTPVKTATQ